MRQRLRWIISRVFIMNLKLFTLITKRPRARVLVVNEHGQVLLIQPYISHGFWTLPGGGLKRNETAATAARRELYEETGIDVNESELTFLATLARPDYDIPFTAPLFRVQVRAAALPHQLANPREVVQAMWFNHDQLPSPLSRIALTALKISESHKG